ncbi:hypothetical protein HYPSUDRAFT_988665 [Hypholoma sublateritium FD-334 SS-4]|uniref:Zn(2)-C6 fungal-type domain-containing protein n=1 Tax=Hypholoma sublateritium (strain FD-334 SS-4) TaxID=945553 RepID=A0A0D2LHP8_HYPSF|nr:hypothetical protein HYPSUDRAFT_988665 [Hypholoma sublateritium FD-334 SS-4]
MGFQESNGHVYSLMNFAAPRPRNHHGGSEQAPITSNVSASFSDMEFEREGSASPRAITDEGSTSPVPSGGDSGAEGISEVPQPRKPGGKSGRPRTSQACDKCRERKTKCSGNRPVCVRCLNRGLLCEYSVRETRARSLVRTRPIPSPNPFQVNGSGRPTPAYHSRMGQSQTNAYDRSPRSYGALTSTSPLAPPSTSLPPLKSRSVPGNGYLNGLASHRGLIIPRTEHEDRYTSKKHYGSLGPESGLWDISSPQSQSSANSDFDHRRQAIIASYATESHQDKGLNYDYMAPDLTTEQALSTSAYTIQSDERNMLHPHLGNLSYHEFLTRVDDQFSIQSDGSIALLDTLQHGETSSAAPASSAASRYPSGIPDPYQYAKDPALLFRPDVYDGTAGYAAWGTGDTLSSPLQDAAPEFSTAGFSTAYASYSDRHLPPAMRARSGAPTSLLEHMSPPLGQRAGPAAEPTPYAGRDAFHGAPLYGLPDTPPEAAYTPPAPVPDPGARFGDYRFFR